MSRERAQPDYPGLRKVLQEALRTLRAEGYSAVQEAELLAEPIDPRKARFAELTVVPAEFERWCAEVLAGDEKFHHFVILEICTYLRRQIPLPPRAMDYLLEAIEGRDDNALGWKGPKNRPPLTEHYLAWSRALLVIYLADGQEVNRATALDKVAQLYGMSSGKKVLEVCGLQLARLRLWGYPRKTLAALAVRACRTILELKPEKSPLL